MMRSLLPRALAFALAALTVGPAAFAADNQLSADEAAAGWQLLFDGSSMKGWRGYRKGAGAPMPGWAVDGGLLHTIGGVKGNDIVTDRLFTDFELTWEWKLPPAGNNGVKYFVTENRPKSPGHEYQMLDDADPKYAKARDVDKTAAFYDVLPAAASKSVKPAGEWNHSRLVVRGNVVEHWLNGAQVLRYELGSDAVKAGIARSKFKNDPGFGAKISGPIMLTFHNDTCWFRNIKLRELK